MKILFLTFILLFPLLTFANIPAFPMAFWGTVTIDDNPAPVGTIVRAYYGSTLAGTATVQETGIYGYTQSTKQKLVIGEGPGSLTFTFESPEFNEGLETFGNLPTTHTSFSSGETVQKKLAFTTKTVTTEGSSGGSGSNSSSGGSNKSGSTASEPVEQVLGITSSSTDNKIVLQRKLLSLLIQLVSLLQLQLQQLQTTG